jgi:hypothetical protein
MIHHNLKFCQISNFVSHYIPPVPGKMRLEIVIGIQNEILDGEVEVSFQMSRMKTNLWWPSRISFCISMNLSSRERVVVCIYLPAIFSTSRDFSRALDHPLWVDVLRFGCRPFSDVGRRGSPDLTTCEACHRDRQHQPRVVTRPAGGPAGPR